MLPETEAVPFGDVDAVAKKLATGKFAAFIVMNRLPNSLDAHLLIEGDLQGCTGRYRQGITLRAGWETIGVVLGVTIGFGRRVRVWPTAQFNGKARRTAHSGRRHIS